MSTFRKLVLYDENDSPPEVATKEPKLEISETLPEPNVAPPKIEKENDIKIDENFFRFVEDIVQRYIAKKPNLIKGIKQLNLYETKKRVPLAKSKVKKPKRVSKPKTLKQKVKKTVLPKTGLTLKWIYR